MDTRSNGTFLRIVGLYVRASTALSILLAFTLVIPLTIWFAWTRHSTISEPVVLTLFCLSFAWLGVSILQWQRSFRKLGQASSTRLLLGPRPEDPDELRVWQWGRHYRYSFLAVVLCMLAFGITLWLHGE